MVKQTHAHCLAPHHQIPHLLEHAMKHFYHTLIHVWDIHQLINHFKKDLDWKKLCNEAEEFQLKRPLFYSLWLCKKYFNACVPQEIMESLRSYRTGLGEKTFSWLLRHGKRKEKLCWFFIYPIFPAGRKK
ncbi:MAG: nucleotidyltransferase family protein [Planctomycetota bacterium]